MSGVTTAHPLYSEMAKVWQRTRDAIKGDYAVKRQGRNYLYASWLPTNPTPSQTARFNAYLNNSYFMDATGQAAVNFSGMVFRKPTQYDLPPAIDQYAKDIDNSGRSINEFAKWCLTEIQATGACYVLAEHHASPENLTKAQQIASGVRPFLAGYTRESLINWKTQVVNGSEILTLAVLCEEVDAATDEFSHDFTNVYRVLRLKDGVYTQQLYSDDGTLGDEYVVRKADGSTYDRIQLYVAGSQSNDYGDNVPMLSGIAELNYRHYQTTADLRDNLHIFGQSTLFVYTNIDQERMDEYNPNGIKVGSHVVNILEAGDKAELVSCNSSSNENQSEY